MRTVNIILISIIIIIAFAGEFVASLELQPIEQPFKKEIIAIDNKLDFYKDYDRIVKIHDKEQNYNITIESTQVMIFDKTNPLKWSYSLAGEDILHYPYGYFIQANKICDKRKNPKGLHDCVFYPDLKQHENDTAKVYFTEINKNWVKATFQDDYDPWIVQTGDANGLVLWMKFDNNLTDEAGTAESFSTYGNANFSIDSKIGSHSAYFDGSGDKFQADTISYDIGTDTSDTLPFMISLWAKINASKDNNLYSEANADTFSTSTTSYRVQHMLQYNGTSDNLMLYTTDGSHDFVWTHFVLMHNDTHTCIYNNSYRGYCEARPGSVKAAQAGGYAAFGEKRYGSRDTHGYIDDVCIWHNVTFNDSLIEWLYLDQLNNGTSCGDWYLSLNQTGAGEGGGSDPSNYTENLTGCYDFDYNANAIYGSYDVSLGGDASVQQTSSKIGDGALNCPGSNDYGTIDAQIIQNSAFTIALWEHADGTTNTGYIYSDGNDVNNLFFRRLTTTDRWNGQVGDATSIQANLARGVWQFHTLVHHSNGTYELYINGTQQTSGTGSNFVNITSTFYLCDRQDLLRDYDGKLDELMIWEKALNSTEVAYLYNSSNGISCSSLTGNAGSTPSYESSVYYVNADSGSDSNNGTETTSPFKTIHHACNVDFNITATIYLNRADIFNTSCNITKENITINAYGTGARPLIKELTNSSGSQVHFKDNADRGAIYNINFLDGFDNSIESDLVDYITLKNITINNTYEKPINIDDANHILIENVWMYDSGWKNRDTGAQGEGFWIQDSTNVSVINSGAYRHGGVVMNCFSSKDFVLNNFTSIDHNPDNNPYDGLPSIYYDNCNYTTTTNSYIRNGTIGIGINAETAGDFTYNHTITNNLIVETGRGLNIESNQAGSPPYIANVNMQYNTVYNTRYYRGPVNAYSQQYFFKEVENFTFKHNVLIDTNSTRNHSLIVFENTTNSNWIFDYNFYNVTTTPAYPVFKYEFSPYYGSTFATWQAKNIDTNSILSYPLLVDYSDFIPYNNSPICNSSDTGSYVGYIACSTQNAPVTGCNTSYVNTSWSFEGYLSSCYINDTRLTNYSRIQYDQNGCNTTNTSYSMTNLTYCNNCSYSLTYTAWSNVSDSCGIRYFNDTNWLQCGNVTGLASDLYGNDTVNIQYTYNETLVCSASPSLSAEQASCILNGTYTDGTYCAIGRSNMGGLAITIFMLSVAGALLITPRLIKQFHEHWFPDLIIRRGLVIVGIYTMVLASATMATISETYGLGLERTFMYTFIPVFGWAGYILMIWLGFQAIVDATKMYKDKRAEEYGWK